MLHTFAACTWDIYGQQVQFLVHAASHHFEYIPRDMEGPDRNVAVHPISSSLPGPGC